MLVRGMRCMAEETHDRWIRKLSGKLPVGVPVSERVGSRGQVWPVTFGVVREGQAVHDLDEDDPEGGMALQCLHCAHYIPLDGRMGMDWGACSNPDSEYDREVVFEHWTCSAYTPPDGFVEDGGNK